MDFVEANMSYHMFWKVYYNSRWYYFPTWSKLTKFCEEYNIDKSQIKST